MRHILSDADLEHIIRDHLENESDRDFQILRRGLVEALTTGLHALETEEPFFEETRRKSFVQVLRRTVALLRIIENYHAARKEVILVKAREAQLIEAANSAKGSWSGTLAEVIARYALSDEDQRRIAVSLTKLVESKRAEHAAARELIETLTTVLPQGG